MNCPTCDGFVPDDCWTASPPFPKRTASPPGRSASGGETDPQSTDHQLTLWCEFCQMAAVATVRVRRGFRQIVSIRSVANARDVGRLLYRLPNARVRFVTSRRRRSKDGRARLDRVGGRDGRVRGNDRLDDGRAEPDTTPAALTPADDASARAGRPRPSRQEVGTAGPRPAGGGGVTR